MGTRQGVQITNNKLSDMQMAKSQEARRLHYVYGKPLSHLFDKPILSRAILSPINLLNHFDSIGLPKITWHYQLIK